MPAPDTSLSISIASRWLVTGGLIAAPTVLAFFTGGVLPATQDWATVVAWVAVAVAAVTWRGPLLPTTAEGRVALVALAGLAAWVALSARWSTLGGPASSDRVRMALYVAVFALACSAWPNRRALRALEPALILGATVVIGYGLAGRFLPDVVELSRSTGAGGLLEQPITYWNATGAVAAVGIVLAARVVGDATRAAGMRSAAAAVTPLLTAGLFLTASRGAEAAAVGGLLMLFVLEPRRAQVRAFVVTALGGAAGVAATVPFPAVRALEGDSAASQGLLSMVLLSLVCAFAGALGARAAARRAEVTDRALHFPGQRFAAIVVSLAIIGVVAGAAAVDKGSRPVVGPGSKPSAAVKVSGNRIDYWGVAGRTFVDHPLKGAGTGSFATEWARERTIPESVRDAHSLYIETAAELGLVGLALLGAFVIAMGFAAARARRQDAGLVAGLCAALVTLAAHAGVDWDWEVPAVSLITLVVAGALIAASAQAHSEDSAPAHG